jgi:hypothetical protein
MATLYTTSLRLALPTTGELAGSWGTVVNQSITEMVEQAVTGVATINTWGVAPDPANTHTLTTVNGGTDESRCAVLVLSGSPSGAVTVIAPSVRKVYIINNTLSYDATIKTASGTGVIIPANNILTVYGNGVDFFNTLTGLSPTVTIGGELSGSTTKRALQITSEVQSGVTSRATMFYSNPSTEADTFTLANLEGFRAEQGTFGAGSTITNQFGFVAGSDLTGATFNYGYYANLAATAASTITNINGNGVNVAVDTSAAHNLADGDKVYISQVPMSKMTSGTYNGGPFTVQVTGATSFTYPSTAQSSAAATSGFAVFANNYNLYTSSEDSYFGGPVIARVSSVLPALNIRQTSTGNAFVVEDSTNDLTPFVINNAGAVIIGSTEQITSAPLNIINASGAAVNLGRNDASVTSGDLIGGFTFYANDNTTTTWNDVALIAAYAGGTHADNDYPTYLSFSTTQVAGSSPVERVRIASNGLTTVGFTATAAGTALSTTAPAVFYADTLTYTDTQTAGAGTVTHGTFSAFQNSTLAATNVVTYTNASTVYVDGAPSAGSNVTITNPYALYVAAGANYFGGAATFNSTATIAGVVTLNSSPIITTTNAGGATSLTIWNKGDSNASTTVELIAQQAVSGTTPRNGGKIVFGRENASAWTTTSNADGFLAFETVLNNTDTERVRITSAGYVGINETVPDTYLHIKTALTTAPVLLESTEAAGAIGPFIDFYRNSASPAAGDDLGGLVFYGNDSAATKQEYARIFAEIQDPTTTSEDADLVFSTVNAGTVTVNMRLTSAGDLEIPNGVLGVGTATPATLIDMAASNSGLLAALANNTLRFTDTDTSTATDQPLGKIEFYTSDTSTAARVVSYIMSKAQGSSGGGDLRFATSTNTGNATETMVLSAAGDLTVTGTVTADGTTLYPPTRTAVVAASGSLVSFTGIPAWPKKITVVFDQVSLSNGDQIMIQIGDSGGIETSGYTGGSQVGNSPFGASGVNNEGYPIYFSGDSYTYSGALTLYNVTGNLWVLSGVLGRSDGYAVMCGGSKTLSSTLTQLRIVEEPGSSATFDGGQCVLLYE